MLEDKIHDGARGVLGRKTAWFSWALVRCILAGILCLGCKEQSKEIPRTAKRTEPGRVEQPEIATKPGTVPAEQLTGAEFYRAQPLDPHVRAIPLRLAKDLKKDPEQHIGELAAFLVVDANDDFHRVKRIHDWVADNIRYDVESYYGDLHNAQTGLKGVLSSGQSVCEGYATVFERLCQEAGITVHKVSGHARGASYDPFAKEDASKSNHAWNVVSIEGRNYLVDTTWDAGSVTGARVFEKRYSTAYLFTNPLAFLHTHFPTDSQWQLIDRPLSAEEFVALPALRGRFFQYGLELATADPQMEAAKTEALLRFRLPENVQVSATLTGSGRSDTANTVLVQHGEGSASVAIRFPAPGDWLVRLFVGEREGDDALAWAASFPYRATAGSPLRFPTQYKQFSELQCNLESPMHAPLARGSKVPFRLRVPGVEEVAAVVDGNRWVHLERLEHDLYAGEVPVNSARSIRLVARLHPEDESFQGLLEFPVH